MSSLTQRLQLKYPLIVAPMAGGPSSVELVAASSRAGALGSMGAAYLSPAAIAEFVEKLRLQTEKAFAVNLFIPTPEPVVTTEQLAKVLQVTSTYRKELGLPDTHLAAPYEENFDAQFEAVLKLKPQVLSFVFGLLAPEYVQAAKKENIYLIGTATSFFEAQQLEDSGVDAMVLQGIEGGGHRGLFDAKAEDPEIKAFDLLSSCVGKIQLPLIAAGGIMTSAHIQKSLSLGAEAVQMGTAFLACKEAGTSSPYRKKLLETSERKTKTTRAFSGRLARGIENRFMLEVEKHPEAILPFPAQNKFTRDLRKASALQNSSDFLSLWAGTGTGALWEGSVEYLIESLFK